MKYSAVLLGFAWLVMIENTSFAAILPMNHIVEVSCIYYFIKM